MLHRHHIVPRHAGGTDDEDNIAFLTIEDHAEAHRKLFEEYGRLEDRLAWKGLAGLLSKDEIVRELQVAGGVLNSGDKNPWKGKKTKRNFLIDPELRLKASLASAKPESIEKRKQTMAKNGHQQGSKNAQFGKHWFNDSKKNYCVKPDDVIVRELNLVRGRITA